MREDESGDEANDKLPDVLRDKRKVILCIHVGEVSSVDKVMHARTRKDCK